MSTSPSRSTRPIHELPSRNASNAQTAVKHWMTPTPYSVGMHQPLATAHRIMREHGVRHLPVLESGKLVGIVTERDISFVRAIPGVDLEKTCVEDAMTQHVYCVPPEARLRQVVSEMAEQRYGSAVVVEGTKVVGVFTTTDALDVLAHRLSREP